jgi:hypothetical protein
MADLAAGTAVGGRRLAAQDRRLPKELVALAGPPSSHGADGRIRSRYTHI